jgi:hypothetical protein
LPYHFIRGGILANDDMVRRRLCGRAGPVGKRQDLTLSFALN